MLNPKPITQALALEAGLSRLGLWALIQGSESARTRGALSTSRALGTTGPRQHGSEDLEFEVYDLELRGLRLVHSFRVRLGFEVYFEVYGLGSFRVLGVFHDP